jgi:teichuronic acid biosynthesis glycosyltransferase TuaG
MKVMISILIPIYNGIEYLNESLSSVISQTYTKWEVIIGINGHHPNSDVENLAIEIKNSICPTYLKESVKIKYYETKGKSATLNAMVKDCTYDLIAILDVDDIWLPNKLEKQCEYFDKYDVIGTNCQYFQDLHNSPSIPYGNITNFDFLSLNPIINSSAIIKKQNAIWNEKNNIGLEDYELWLQLWIQGKTFYNVPDILCLHRIHKNSSFNNSNSAHVQDLKNKYICKELHLLT